MACSCVLNHVNLISALIMFLPISALAQNGTITVGSSLRATNNIINASTTTAWFSPSGDFAFGFQQIQGNDNDLFLLSIWYDKIPDKTIVWFPNEATPVPLGSQVELSAGRGLVLTDPRGEEIWTSELPGLSASGGSTSHIIIAHGVLNDTGNFELVAAGNDSTRVWSSFDHPSDTLLPTQIMERNGTLYPRTTETNFSKGRFSFLFQDDGNLLFYTLNDASNYDRLFYYVTGTSDYSDPSNSGTQLIFTETGRMDILKGNGQRVNLFPPVELRAADYYFRATFNFDGVFSLYYHPRIFTGNQGWTTSRWLPSNICLVVGENKGRGVCGDNNVCKLQDAVGRPLCECPRGYSLLDPNDTYGSCKPNFNLSCDHDVPKSSSEESFYDLEELPGTDWPPNSYEKMELISRESCRNSCLTVCSCAAAIYQGTTCSLKTLPLWNGRNTPQVNGTAFLKFAKGDLPSRTLPLVPERQKDRGFGIVVGSVLLGSSMFFNFVLMVAVCLGYFLIYRRKKIKLLPDGNAVETNLRCFSYEELAEATNGFNEELGRGGFGIVYKGIIGTSSQNVVAVKKLDKVVQNGDKEFKTEVDAIAKTHHKNLVRLLGLCDEGEHRLLVYEYMSKGTLASFLFADEKPSWKQRTQIALGIARGLSYLHEECSIQIIHCDIKPQNILLDEHYNARISDFGLAKILMLNHSQTHTAIRGTKGYLAPEWFRSTPVTVKVDVYSFGVLLLEIISCRRNVMNLENCDQEKAILTDWAWDCFQGGKLDSLVDDDLEILRDWQTFEMFVMVGIWCIQEDPSLRPTMRKVSLMLEGVIQVTKPPSPSPSSIASCQSL